MSVGDGELSEVPEEINQLMKSLMSQESIEKWWYSKNPALGEYSPSVQWRVGEKEKVISLIKALEPQESCPNCGGFLRKGQSHTRGSGMWESWICRKG